MKLELFVNDTHPQINQNIKYLHLSNINSIDNAGCDSIEVNDCLDYTLERDTILNTVIGKLRYNGELKISGVDLDEVMDNSCRGIIQLQQVQQLLYAGRMSCDTYENMIAKLQNAKLTITHEVLDDNRYFITAKRVLTE